MKEGWWINYRRGVHFLIHEHELWVRDDGNARQLGLSPQTIRQFGQFRPRVDRDRFLLWLMGLAPVMRVRGHGDFVTFEYHSRLKNLPLAAVAAFAKKEAAPTTRLHIVNLASLESLDSSFDAFLRGLRRQGASSLWRAKAKPLGPILTRKACEKCGAAACHGVGTEKEQKQHKEKRS